MCGNLNEYDDEFMNGDFRECDCDEGADCRPKRIGHCQI